MISASFTCFPWAIGPKEFTLYQTMTPYGVWSLQKPIGLYMGDLIPDIILQYMHGFWLFKLFLMGAIELKYYSNKFT